MEKFGIVVVTLTDAQLDLIKLALLDAFLSVAAPMTKDGKKEVWKSESCLGMSCVFMVTTNDTSARSVINAASAALDKRGIQYLTLMAIDSSNWAIDGGNIVKDVPAVQGSPYREQG